MVRFLTQEARKPPLSYLVSFSSSFPSAVLLETPSLLLLPFELFCSTFFSYFASSVSPIRNTAGLSTNTHATHLHTACVRFGTPGLLWSDGRLGDSWCGNVLRGRWRVWRRRQHEKHRVHVGLLLFKRTLPEFHWTLCAWPILQYVYGTFGNHWHIESDEVLSPRLSLPFPSLHISTHLTSLSLSLSLSLFSLSLSLSPCIISWDSFLTTNFEQGCLGLRAGRK